MIRDQVSPLISLSAHQERIGQYKLQEDVSTPSIVIPTRFNPPGKSLLISLFNFTEWRHISYIDFFLNILFFIPFGLLLRLLLEKFTNRYYLSFFITIMTGLFLTITIETLQSFLPVRYTSILDVLSNTLGTIAGAMIITFSWVRQLLNLQRQK
jgi:glycopeptide antibiotics resistance protein